MQKPSCQTNQLPWIAGGLLALLPVGSWILQYWMSVRAETDIYFFRNYTVAYVDWVFVPFNFVVVRAIDWRRGAAIAVIALLSTTANIVGHAAWQYHGIDGGHMIARSTQIVLPAGWVHLGFSIIEGTLLFVFVFARAPSRPSTLVATVLAVAYFVSAGFSGYVINHGVIATDLIMVSTGLALVVVYPYIIRRFSRHLEARSREILA